MIKRLCAVLITEQPKKNTNYLASMLEAWNRAQVETCLITTDENLARQLGQSRERNIPRAVRHCREGGFDELILMTDGLMGPVYPLEDLLSRMDGSKTDFWCLTRDAAMVGFPRSTWAWMESARTPEQAADDCRKAGLSCGELYDTSDWEEVTRVPMLDEPLALTRDRKCPFFAHEVFHRNYSDVITTTLGHQGQVFYRWLQKESGWDTNLLWDYLLPSCHQQDYCENMHLTYVLPTVGTDKDWTAEHLREHKLALVMHLYYPDKLSESCAFAARFPEQTHVIITTSDEEKRQLILEAFAREKFASLDVRVIENRGRDVSSLLVGAAEVFDEYDYVCFFHDKKTLQTKPGSIGAGFAYRLQENLFATSDYVCNVIRLFAGNPRLGMLSPPAPHHGDYFFTLGLDWGPNYAQTRRLADQLGFRAPMSKDRMPIAPLGTCFWFRGKALKPLSDHHWKYEEFPPEPNNADGTILHAVERIYPFACVEAGYYPAYVLSDRYAGVEYSSLRYYVREFNRVCINHGSLSYQRNMCDTLREKTRG